MNYEISSNTIINQYFCTRHARLEIHISPQSLSTLIRKKDMDIKEVQY